MELKIKQFPGTYQWQENMHTFKMKVGYTKSEIKSKEIKALLGRWYTANSNTKRR